MDQQQGEVTIMDAPVATRPRNNFMQTAGAQAIVQRSLAEVQVAVMMAKQFPRDKIEAKEKLMVDCCRESLAKVAMYSYARGGTEITGPTIRLAEAIKNAWGNMQSGWREVSRAKGADGIGISEVETFAWDTENNTRESTSITVRHWRDTKRGGYALTDERDIKELLANQAKRLERGCILNIVDGDMVEAALAQCNTTLTTQVKVTPERITGMVNAFHEEFGVTKEQIEKRIQRRIDAINPALMISLTKIYNSMKDGMSNATDWFEAETPTDDGEKKTKTDEIKNKLKKSAKDTPTHDPETGEIKDSTASQDQAKSPPPDAEKKDAAPEQPRAIPVGTMPGNSSKADWEGWSKEWARLCAAMHDAQSLEKLHKLNSAPLGNIAKLDPVRHEWCMEQYSVRMAQVGGLNA